MRKLIRFFIFAAFSVIAMAASARDGADKHWQVELGVGPTFGYS